VKPSHVALLLAAAAVVSAMPLVATRAQDSAGGTTNVAISQEGARIYQQICQACHMADARGGGGAGTGIPGLADNPRLADKAYAIEILVTGRGGMPWFTDILSPAQIAAVLTHVRSQFNAYPDAVTVAEVEAAIAHSGGSGE
jgi:mono/diheme cytochrome c family protein